MADPGAWFVDRARRLKRRVLGVDERLRDGYLRSHPSPMLHVGGGHRLLAGWLNADIEMIPGVLCMDAARPFPFADGAFGLVFTEHMIEHVNREEGQAMLRECHRVLRAGG